MSTTLESPTEHSIDISPRKRTLLDYVGLVARGFAMGAADVVPGVSGGTMAFILGVYEELINSIRALMAPAVFQRLFKLQFRELFAILPWPFLLALSTGIFTAIFSLAPFLEWTLVNHPALLWAFFFGLVVASIFSVIKRVNRWNIATYSSLVIGAIAAYLIVGLVPVETPREAWFVFLSGTIAICAMILPGISGSFLLVLMGQYQHILSAVNNRDIMTLLAFGAGAGIGLLTFSQVLGWLFKRYHDVTIALLIGLMIGSLRKIWPWKETLEYVTDRHGELVPVVQNNVLPDAWTTEVTYALLLAVTGFVVVFVLDYLANRRPASIAQKLEAS